MHMIDRDPDLLKICTNSDLHLTDIQLPILFTVNQATAIESPLI